MCFDKSSVHLEKPRIVVFIVNHVCCCWGVNPKINRLWGGLMAGMGLIGISASAAKFYEPRSRSRFADNQELKDLQLAQHSVANIQIVRDSLVDCPPKYTSTASLSLINTMHLNSTIFQFIQRRQCLGCSSSSRSPLVSLMPNHRVAAWTQGPAMLALGRTPPRETGSPPSKGSATPSHPSQKRDLSLPSPS